MVLPASFYLHLLGVRDGQKALYERIHGEYDVLARSARQFLAIRSPLISKTKIAKQYCVEQTVYDKPIKCEAQITYTSGFLIWIFKDNINSNGIPRSSLRNIYDIPLNSEVLEFLDIPRVHCSPETIS
jgi:hypothetical protein